jgi:hypothetical protein
MEIKKVGQDVSSLLKMGTLEKGKMESDLFKRILEGASSHYHDGPNSLSSSPGSEGISPGPISPAAPLDRVSELKDSAQVRLQGIQSTEKTLELLEQYQKAMADPDQSLKNIHPLIQSLSQELQGLHILSEKLSPSDPLQSILTNTGIVSAVEIEKFYRGEYI